MATVHEIEQRLITWAPRESAMDWDNVGHLVGDPEQEVERAVAEVEVDIGVRVCVEAAAVSHTARRGAACGDDVLGSERDELYFWSDVFLFQCFILL